MAYYVNLLAYCAIYLHYFVVELVCEGEAAVEGVPCIPVPRLRDFSERLGGRGEVRPLAARIVCRCHLCKQMCINVYKSEQFIQ